MDGRGEVVTVKRQAIKNIDGKALKSAIKEHTNKNVTTISREMGFSEGYLSNAMTLGKMGTQAVVMLREIYGIPESEYVVEERAVETKRSPLTEEQTEVIKHIETNIATIVNNQRRLESSMDANNVLFRTLCNNMYDVIYEAVKAAMEEALGGENRGNVQDA